MENYHAIDRISAHQLMDLYISPELWKYRRENKMEATDAMNFGSLVHCFILKPDDFYHDFVVVPKVDRRTKEGKQTYAEFEVSSLGKIVVTEDQVKKAREMSDRVRISTLARSLLDVATHREVPHMFEFRGVLCKMKPDAYSDKTIIDYKTTSSLSSFQFDFRKYHYDLQAAWYLRADSIVNQTATKKTFYIIAQETVAPYQVQVFQVGQDSLAVGWNKVEKALDNYKLAKETGVYFGLDQEIKEL
jgi:exodeoxyribonuclease VIII